MTYFKDLYGRLCQSRRWVAAQFGITLLLILIGLAWTRLPEKHLWQVALTLLMPLLVAISALELQAGTMRSLADNDGKRVKLVWGAMTLLVWVAVVWVSWAILNWCDDRIPQWAGYLNSRSSAHARAQLFTYEHIVLWMTILEWVLRWVVVPAKVIPYAVASAQWGWRLPWRSVLHLLWNWRWWLGVLIAALVAVWLPGHFFTASPHGSVHAQELRVALKLAASYLLAVGSWVMLLAWAGVLFGRQKPLPKNDGATELFTRLCESRRWVGAMFGWVLLFTIVNRTMEHLLNNDSGLQAILSLVMGSAFLIAALVLQVIMLRSLLSVSGKRVRLVWGALVPLLWLLPAVVALALLDSLHILALQWLLDWLVVPAIIIPFAAASAVWGLRLPWRRVLRVAGAWRWWLGVLLAALAWALVSLFVTALVAIQTWVAELKLCVASLLQMGIWVLLLGWFAVLFARQKPHEEEQLLSLGLAGTEDKGQQDSV